MLSTNFEDDRCTQLSHPQYAGVTELVEVARITNNTALGAYPFPAIFHSNKKGCGATQENPGGTTGLITGANVAPGQSGEWTHTFKIPERNACGRWQFDNDARNGEIAQPTLRGGVGGRVIDSGVDCPECGTTAVTVTVTGEGLTRTVKVTFQGEKPNKKATVDFGDGSPTAQVANGGTVQHTWPYGSYTVSASLNVDGLDQPCTGSAVVNNERQCEPVWTELPPEITEGEWGECSQPAEASVNTVAPACSQSHTVRTVIREQNSCTQEVRVKSDETTTVSRPCDCPNECAGVGEPSFSLNKVDATTTSRLSSSLTYPAGFTGSIENDPDPASGYPGGSATSGVSYDSIYNRPANGNPPLVVSYTWHVRKG
jgi:hypothetical protein